MDPDLTPDPTPFFNDFKDVKKYYFCVKFLFCKHFFSPLNTFMRNGKDTDPEPDPDPYLWQWIQTPTREGQKHTDPADPDHRHCCKRLPHLILTALDVGGEVDLLGQLCDVHFEPLLHLVQDLGVGLLRHESDGQALSQEEDEVFSKNILQRTGYKPGPDSFQKNRKY